MGTARISFDKWQGSYAARMESVRSSAIRDLFAAASRSDVISFSGGMPEVASVPARDVARVAHDAIDEHSAVALQYGSSEGRPGLRDTIVELMAEIGVRLGPDDVVVTTGAQQALDLLGKVLIDRGDTIVTEGPTYVGALQAFSAYRPNTVCVPMDDEGMRVDLLERELARIGPGGAKFLYTIPNFQNPAGVTLTPHRRRRLLELAREYRVPVIEDDPYGRLRFDGGHVKPLKALDDEVVYVGTFSKIFAPGLRLGWMAAPRPILSKVLLAKQAADLCGSAFTQVIAEEYFTKTRWRRVLQELTRTYHERRDAMLEALEEHFPPEIRWTVPQGGFFIWVILPRFIDSNTLLAEAVDHGVTFVPGDGFFPDGRGRNCMRLAFCYAEPDAIGEGIRRLAEVLEDRLELYRAFLNAGALPGGADAYSMDETTALGG
jgi:2-aminoadipate transaminase